MVSRADPSLGMNIFPFLVVGRAAPTAKNEEPKIFRMKIFSKNDVMAKSKFWYFMKKIQKAKKTGGEILSCVRLRRPYPNKINNYAVWLRYDSRTSTHNMYKEYRDVSETGAISQMYAEMTGRHRALHSSIQIMRIAAIPKESVRRPHILQITKGTQFPIVRQLPLINKRYRKTFSRVRPQTFFH